MVKVGRPRSGSLQFWPRKKAKKETARVRSWSKGKEAKMLAFAGYKAGMTQISFTDNNPTSMMKGKEVIVPVTIIECPPIKVMGIRFYKVKDQRASVVGQIYADNLDKSLSKVIILPKKGEKKEPTEFDYITLLVHTQPKQVSGIPKKKPEIFEVAVSGKKDDQLAYAKEQIGKDIKVEDVLKEGQQVDAHAVTKGKGYQGPVKRFGLALRAKKSEKTKRGPGSLGPWCGQGHIMWRIAYAGQTGYHQRTEYNKWVISISNETDKINPKGGFIRYGEVKNSYILLKGSLPGPVKRLIKLTDAIRPTKKIFGEAPAIEYISQESKQ